MLGTSLIRGGEINDAFEVPVAVILICATVMTLGTLIGGGRIIKKVGIDMVSLDASEGTAADMSSSGVLVFCSMLGIPVSTTHSKACAMMGVGMRKPGGANKRIISQMILAWILTFPICGGIGFLLSYIMLRL